MELLTFLAFLFIILLFIGLIRPTIMSWLLKNKTNRKNILILLGATFLFMLITVDTEEQTANKEVINIENTKQQKIEVTKTLINKNQDESNTEISEQETVESEKILYKIVKVIDGDTVDVNINGKTERLRLIGINTPETVDPRKSVECFGEEASNKAKELLNNQLVSLEDDSTQGNKDKYDRLLRYVYLEDGTNFNELMIKSGYAYEYTYNTPYKYQSEFKEAEKYARENKFGLWADGVCEAEEPIANDTEPISIPKTIAIPQVEKTSNCNCSGNIYNCGDFSTHVEAQSLYECCGGINNDIHRLDRDKDGLACETLP